jgi:hypothetical protein
VKDNDILDDVQLDSYHNNSKSWLLLLLIHFVLFGAGLLYADKRLNRSWIYVFSALYAWASFANIFLKVNNDMREFHNQTAVGASTVFIGWGIAYIVGGIDALITFGRRKNGH